MDSPTVVVLMIDGLRARALGAYGNTWYSTPALDRLASESLVFDRCLAESTDLQTAYRGMWSGRHALDTSAAESEPSLIARLTQQGYHCHLVTDEPTVTDLAASQAFDEITQVAAAEPHFSDEVFDTGIGRVLEAAADVLGGWASEYEQPRLLWVHTRGLFSPWDAPTELAQSLLDEDDPELEPSYDVPDLSLDDDDEAADLAFLAGCRYAGQVMTLDRCLGAIDNLVAELWPDQPPTFVLGSPRGFALGEHQQLGLRGAAYRELFHVPLLVRSVATATLSREASLLQTSDLPQLLTQLGAGGPPTATSRHVAAGQSGDSRYLEVEGWTYVTRPQPDDQPTRQLFVFPDDLWQANDVASLCAAEIEQLSHLSATIAERGNAGQPWRELKLSEDEAKAE